MPEAPSPPNLALAEPAETPPVDSRVKLAVRASDGTKRHVEIPRRELIRRAQAAAVARQMMYLVRHHHVTEAGRRVLLEHQWQQIYADPSTDMRLISPAQRGKTLRSMVKCFAQLSLGLSVGWVMPKENKVQELVHGKLDLTIKNTPYYKQLQDLSEGSDGTRFKTFGRFAKLYVVTANSADELTSFSADAMHIDERDFCNRVNLPMYPSRMLHSPYKFTDEISTPTVPGNRAATGQMVVDNIHSEFLNGDQHRYFSRCPHCGLEQILEWEHNVVRLVHDESGRIVSFTVRDLDWSPGSPQDLRVCCRGSSCGRPFDRTLPGRWRPQNPGARIRSYWIEALASVVGLSVGELLEKFGKSLGNPSKLQQFWNMDLGRPFAGGMMGFTDDLFKRCEGTHAMLQSCDGPCTIGIDVNQPWVDVQISRWIDGKQIKVYAAKLQGGEDELMRLIQRFRVAGGVIDQQPEARFAQNVQERALKEMGCHIVRCKYATNEQANPVVISESGENAKLDPPRLITVNRTWAVDTVYESMQLKTVVWFAEWRRAVEGALVAEFKNCIRKLVINEAGNERFVWEGKPDHQVHAAVYDRLAGEVLGMNVNRDLSDILPVVSVLDHGPLTIGPGTGTPPPAVTHSDGVMIFRG